MIANLSTPADGGQAASLPDLKTFSGLFAWIYAHLVAD
jgi:hypothetical protein